ncbi:hypothetical protein SNK04_014314 [Fusarium graminearum]
MGGLLGGDKPMILIRDRKDPKIKKGNNQWVPLLGRTAAIIEGQDRQGSLIFPTGQHRRGTSRLFEQGYTIPEVAIVTGHRDWKSLKRYTQLAPASLHRPESNLTRPLEDTNPARPARGDDPYATAGYTSPQGTERSHAGRHSDSGLWRGHAVPTCLCPPSSLCVARERLDALVLYHWRSVAKGGLRPTGTCLDSGGCDHHCWRQPTIVMDAAQLGMDGRD